VGRRDFALPLGGENRSDGGRYRRCLGGGARRGVGGNWQRRSSPKLSLEFVNRFFEHPIRSRHSDGLRSPSWLEAAAVVDVAAVAPFTLVVVVAVRNQTQVAGRCKKTRDIWRQSLHRLPTPPSISSPSLVLMATRSHLLSRLFGDHQGKEREALWGALRDLILTLSSPPRCNYEHIIIAGQTTIKTPRIGYAQQATGSVSRLSAALIIASNVPSGNL